MARVARIAAAVALALLSFPAWDGGAYSQATSRTALWRPLSPAEQEQVRRGDEVALKAPANAGGNTLSLAKYIGANTGTDLERVRALYRWITLNIRYDYEAYLSGQSRLTNIQPDDVMKFRLTVCDGYARLFEAVGEHLGLAIFRIEGEVLTPGSRYGPTTGHAWNSVRVGGEWTLMDSTWGAGYIGKKAGEYDRYFMARPEMLIRSHYPSDPKWQMINPPVTLADFMAQGR